MAKKYLIKVETNPSFCGIDAGSVQFANGEAIINECHLVEWFREHEGYSRKVEELKTYAVENNIDLGDATKKADIIAVIKGDETAE